MSENDTLIQKNGTSGPRWNSYACVGLSVLRGDSIRKSSRGLRAAHGCWTAFGDPTSTQSCQRLALVVHTANSILGYRIDLCFSGASVLAFCLLFVPLSPYTSFPPFAINVEALGAAEHEASAKTTRTKMNAFHWLLRRQCCAPARARCMALSHLAVSICSGPRSFFGRRRRREPSLRRSGESGTAAPSAFYRHVERYQVFVQVWVGILRAGSDRIPSPETVDNLLHCP